MPSLPKTFFSIGWCISLVCSALAFHSSASDTLTLTRDTWTLEEPPNQRKVDSLIIQLQHAEENESKVDLLNILSEECLAINFEQSLEYSTMALSLAEKLNYQEGVVSASLGIGNIYINYTLNYYKGLPHLNQALEIAEGLEDKLLLMRIYRQFANLNFLLGAFNKAIEFSNKALEIAIKENLYEERSELYAFLADLYLSFEDSSSANGYYRDLMRTEEAHHFEKASGPVLLSLAKFQFFEGKYPRSIYFYRKALRQFRTGNKTRWASYTYSQLALVYLAMDEPKIALGQAREGLRIAELCNLRKERLDNLFVLANIYETSGDVKNALECYKSFTVMSDSLARARLAEQTEVYQSNFQKVMEDAEAERRLNIEKNQKLEGENNALTTDLAIGASVAALFIALLLFMRVRYKSRINLQLQEQQNHLRELSLVASKTTNSIVIFDKEIKVLWVNEAFTEITGLTDTEVKGKSPFDFPNALSRTQDERREIEMLFRSGVPFTRETKSTNREGIETWISMNVTPVLDKAGKVDKFISVATNITDLVKLEEQYESLVEGSSDSIYEADLKGHFLFVNDKMATLSGYAKEELLNMSCFDLIHPDFVLQVKALYERQIRSAEDTSYVEFPILSKQQTEYWIGQNAHLRTDLVTGKFDRFQMVSRDITAKKLAEEQVGKTYANARLLSEIGKQITSSLSVDEIIDHTYENINRLMDAAVFGIAMYNEEANELRFPAIIENNEKLVDVAFDLSDEQRLGVICFLQDRDIVIGDYRAEIGKFVPSAAVATPVAGGLPDSTIYLPLRSKDRLMGVITVQSFKKNAYDEYQVDMVRSIASFASIAIDNASLYRTMEVRVEHRTKEVRRQKEELEVNYSNTKILSDIGLLISSTLDFGGIFASVHESLMKMMDAEIFGVRMFDKARNCVVYKFEIESGQREPEIEISMTDKTNYTVWCVRNQKKIIINDNEKDYKNYVEKIIIPYGKRPNSLLFYPMIVDGRVIGAITVQSLKRDAYQNYHLDLLKTMASYIGTALDNAELYATLEHKVRERTEEVRQKNKDITASINYARRIQNGMLPSLNFMRQLLPETFVLYKPRDIVSGDFFWMDRNKEKILLAVVDCTGHGVPGAMMSVIGRNLLDQAVNEKGITIPSQILNFLQVGLMVAFGQLEGDKADVFDGMDVGICTLDLKSKKLQFAGANNPMYLIRNGTLEMIKADKMGISAQYQAHGGFNGVELDILPGDAIYLFSDGFADQFGGERNKKFTYGRFAELLLEIHQKSGPEQLEILEKTIEDWRGERGQTDDICLVGTKL